MKPLIQMCLFVLLVSMIEVLRTVWSTIGSFNASDADGECMKLKQVAHIQAENMQRLQLHTEDFNASKEGTIIPEMGASIAKISSTADAEPPQFSPATPKPTITPGELGVDPVYLELLKEAERRSSLNGPERSRRRRSQGERGVVIGPTEGDFNRHTLRALRNAKRIRNVMGRGDDQSVKLALMTSPRHYSILQECRFNKSMLDDYHPEACRLWANGTLFDHVVLTKDNEYEGNDNHTALEQGTSSYWLKALGGYRNAPYVKTLFLDSDSYPCPGFEKLFYLVRPFTKKLWQMRTINPLDFAIGLDQWALSGRPNSPWIPGDKQILSDFRDESQRNTGAVLFNFDREALVDTFAEFIPLVSEHIYKNVATPERKVANDQLPFKVAVYLFERLRPEFVEKQLPMHSSCRSYPGKVSGGIDGFQNGMYPLQQDGKPCGECYCTPCLINHLAHTHDVKINGFHGWEEDFNISGSIYEQLIPNGSPKSLRA